MWASLEGQVVCQLTLWLGKRAVMAPSCAHSQAFPAFASPVASDCLSCEIKEQWIQKLKEQNRFQVCRHLVEKCF